MSISCQVLLEGLNGEPSAGNSNVEPYIRNDTPRAHGPSGAILLGAWHDAGHALLQKPGEGRVRRAKSYEHCQMIGIFSKTFGLQTPKPSRIGITSSASGIN